MKVRLPTHRYRIYFRDNVIFISPMNQNAVEFCKKKHDIVTRIEWFQRTADMPQRFPLYIYNEFINGYKDE